MFSALALKYIFLVVMTYPNFTKNKLLKKLDKRKKSNFNSSVYVPLGGDVI